MKEKLKTAFYVALALSLAFLIMCTLTNHAFAKEAGGIVWTKIECGTERTEISRTDNDPEIIESMKVSAYDMYGEYMLNPITANKRYTGKVISFAAFVKYTTVINGETMAVMNVGVDYDSTEIYCVFSKADSRIMTGSVLIVRGLCQGIVVKPCVTDCSVVF